MDRRRPVAVATGLALLALAIGCGGDKGKDGGAAPAVTGDDDPAGFDVDVARTTGERLWESAPFRPMLTLDGALVTYGEGLVESDRADPLVRSTDGGRTWSLSSSPNATFGYPGPSTLHEIGGIGLLVGGEQPNIDRSVLPTIWVSHDDGASFTAASGVADGVISGVVRTVHTLPNHLLALGVVERQVDDGRVVAQPATWTSADRGSSWTWQARPELGDPWDFPLSAVLSQGVVVAQTRHGLVRSTDGGRSWEGVALPDPGVETLVSLQEARGLVVASGVTYGAPTFTGETAVTFLSPDAGLTWRTSTPLPSVPADDGSEIPLGPLASLQEVGDDLIAVATTNADMARHVSHLLRSTDDGQTWDVVDMGVTCPGDDASAPMSPPAVAGDLVVVTYDCDSRRQPQILASTDRGRTWDEIDDDRIDGRPRGLPFASGEERVSLMAGRGAVMHIALPG